MNDTTCFSNLDDVLKSCDDLDAQEDLIKRIKALSNHNAKKLSALIEETKPRDATEVISALEMLDDFELLEEIRDDFDLGYYLICERKFFGKIPIELELFIDYRQYGISLRCKGLATHTSYGCLFNYSLSHQ